MGFDALRTPPPSLPFNEEKGVKLFFYALLKLLRQFDKAETRRVFVFVDRGNNIFAFD